jgi:glucosyl-dolichyl phosphate glucuronosyltransferase
MTLSVIVCAYTDERWDDLVAAVASVQTQTVRPHQILLVIDYNPTLLARAQAENSFAGVTILENGEAQGLAGSRNTGIAAAEGDIVVFLDDDAVAASDWLAHLLAGYSDPDVIGVGGRITPRWPEERPSWFPAEFDWVVGCTYRGMSEQRGPVRNFIGANMSFRREIVTEIHFYSGIGHINGRPFGGSDPDYCIRVSQRWPGKKLLYEPRALVHHRVSRERSRWHYFWTRCYNEGLSKSLLTGRVGTADGLSSERQYTVRTLPRGLARGLGDAVRGDFSGLGRAAAIVLGLAVTTTGYLAGLAAQRFASHRQIQQGKQRQTTQEGRV